MASAAGTIGVQSQFSTFAKAEDLKKRLWFTLGALLVYRLGTHIPLPGLNPAAYAQAFQNQSGGILGLFNMFSGGAVQRMAIFALGIMPYISASIIVQLMTSVVPALENLKKEGSRAARSSTSTPATARCCSALCRPMALRSALSTANGVVLDPGWFFRLSTVVTLLGGTMFLMWLGEQVTSRGIGNGISLIIFAGIAAGLPTALAGTLSNLAARALCPTGLILAVLVVAVLVIALIVFVERAQRRLLIQYPKRQVGTRMFQGDTSHLPLKLNTVGCYPGDLRIVAAAAAGDRRRSRHQHGPADAGSPRSSRPSVTASRSTWCSTPA